MIYLGNHNPLAIVRAYMDAHNIRKVYTIGDAIGIDGEDCVSWKDCIKYIHYNRFRSTITAEDLVVMNEALCSGDRSLLHFNSIRQYMVQTRHRLIFQRIPFCEHKDDVAILFDMTQNNPFLKLPIREVWDALKPHWQPLDVDATIEHVELSADEETAYKAQKEGIFARLKGSPCLLPRQCLRASEKLTERHKSIVTHLCDFDIHGRYIETQLGVDRYFADIIRQKLQWLKEYDNEYA